MKISRYLSSRILILIIGFISIWNLTYFTLPKYIREDDFGFVAELDRIFRINLIFVILFLLFTLIEIYKFNKRNQNELRKESLFLSAFLLFIFALSIYLFQIYS